MQCNFTTLILTEKGGVVRLYVDGFDASITRF
jgi:hypothetical protein